jgi:HK97 family phage major capsid protein
MPSLSTTRLSDLREERHNLYAQMRSQVDDESRDGMSEDDLEKFNKRGDRLNELDREIRNRELLHDLEARSDAEAAADLERQTAVEARAAESTIAELRSASEYRDAFNALMRGGELDAEQRSTLNTLSDADGGFAVPEEWTALRETLQETAVVRARSEVITTSGGGPLHIPIVEADAAEPGIVAEQAPIPDDAEEFDEVVLGSYKVSQIVKASEEFVQDSLFDVAGFVGRRLGFRLGIKADKFYTVGTGTNQPQGIFPGATVGVSNATAVGYDQLIDLYHSVPAPYRGPDLAFYMNDLTIAALRKLKDTTGRPLWEPSLQIGEPPRIIGVPTVASQFAPAMGAGARSVVCANLKIGYAIRDVLGVSIKYLDQLYAGNDQVGWKGKLRTDGKVVDGNAVKALVQAA